MWGATTEAVAPKPNVTAAAVRHTERIFMEFKGREGREGGGAGAGNLHHDEVVGVG
ncbi:MAG: hypothetical protein ACI9MC_001810 [Kiritimatiellia bacterium]|jgi:hypothetical protein